MVGFQCRARGRDIDNHLCGARGWRPFGRSQAFNDAVVGDAVAGEE